MRHRSTSERVRLRGVLSRIRFASEDGQFAVAELEVDDGGAPVTIVGNLAATKVGQSIEVTGRWQEDRRYGRQLRVEAVRRILPKTREGIEKYLASDMMEGIGATLAKRIVDHFGAQTLRVIDEEPDRIVEVEGIGEKRAAQILETWRENRAIHELMAALRSHGVSAALAVKIFERFGDEALSVLQRNPYRLAEEVRGIGFQRADEIARHVGIELDSPARLRAGLLHVLQGAHDDGHVYLPRRELEDRAAHLLGRQIGTIDDALEELVTTDKIAVRESDKGGGAAVYMTRAYRAEVGAARHLSRIAAGTGQFDLGGPTMERRLELAQNHLGIDLASRQRRAVLSVFERSLAVITGGPGTGKTTIVRAICEIADQFDYEIALAAPTGRAARRLFQTTGRQGRTIHRLLEFSFEKRGFQRDDKRPLDVDILIIDEASMIDIYLLYSLARAVPTGAHLVFVGDIDQLPSVGPGQVLRDIIDSGIAGVVRLTEIFRQSRTSAIVVNAHRINTGQLPIDPKRGEGELVDFYTIHADDPETARRRIVELVTERIPEAFGYDPRSDVQILSPMYRGGVGCDRLNEELQQHFCASAAGLQRGNRSFRLGDRVMQTRNNYDEDIFNGDVGRIVAVDTDEEELIVSFDGQRVTYGRSDLDQLELAYAVTVHKSQGSEYPVVVIPVSTQHYVMLRRNLLYTAVTRARDLVVLVGTRRAVRIAVGNADAGRRYSRLATALRGQGAP